MLQVKTGKIHLVFSANVFGKRCSGCAQHITSSADDGLTWHGHADVAAYGSLITYTDGGSASLSRRERPHLVFDAHGLPVALTNGATDAWPCTHPETCPRDHCFTALQRLNQE